MAHLCWGTSGGDCLTVLYLCAAHSTCLYDGLKIYSVTNGQNPMATLCGSSIPGHFSTFGPMLLNFYSDSMVNDIGFMAEYRAVGKCRGNAFCHKAVNWIDLLSGVTYSLEKTVISTGSTGKHRYCISKKIDTECTSFLHVFISIHVKTRFYGDTQHQVNFEI